MPKQPQISAPDDPAKTQPGHSRNDIDLDRLVWDPEYRAQVFRHRTVTKDRARATEKP